MLKRKIKKRGILCSKSFATSLAEEAKDVRPLVHSQQQPTAASSSSSSSLPLPSTTSTTTKVSFDLFFDCHLKSDSSKANSSSSSSSRKNRTKKTSSKKERGDDQFNETKNLNFFPFMYFLFYIFSFRDDVVADCVRRLDEQHAVWQMHFV